MRYLILILCLSTLIGCQSNPKENAQTLRSGGQLIGQLPDGRNLYRYEITYYADTHYVYVVGDDVTMNSKTGNTRHVNAEIIDWPQKNE